MNRLGFRYFSDINHYRQPDLDTWLPRLKGLGARWLVVKAPEKFLIPEVFIKSLVDAGVKPVLQFNLQPNHLPTWGHLELLCKTYRRWGVRTVTFFDQPNQLSCWRAENWSQVNLVERFLDVFIPLARHSLQTGLIPVFPPLKPGGDYWDTAFLRSALEGLRRRGQKEIIDQLVIGAYAWTGPHPLQYGAGGPERWPNTRPYTTLPGVEDQRGFRIFDWYCAITKAALHHHRPIFLFGTGSSSVNGDEVRQDMNISRLLAQQSVPGLEPIPVEVIGAAFNLAAVSETDPGWFDHEHKPRKIVEEYLASFNKPSEKGHPKKGAKNAFNPSISHYLLLPSYDGGVTDFHLELIRPLIKKYKPTVGFSLKEAQNAKRVTVIGGESAFTEISLNQLRARGIVVERIIDSGTEIASFTANNINTPA